MQLYATFGQMCSNIPKETRMKVKVLLSTIYRHFQLHNQELSNKECFNNHKIDEAE